MKLFKVRTLTLVFSLSFIACQEDKFVAELEPFDEDMFAATMLADEYFNDIRGKSDKRERSITILKYKDGQIYFNTNTDDLNGYQVVTETTITAHVEPGEYVFWYRGGGLNDLEGVDFDEDSEAYLDELPEEYKPDQMWVMRVPDDYDVNHDHLKYDIVYESKDNKGVVIRLDPKIQVSQSNGEE